jgi:hypothetical protein
MAERFQRFVFVDGFALEMVSFCREPGVTIVIPAG